MSVLIKDIEMPNTCIQCPLLELLDHGDWFCKALYDPKYTVPYMKETAIVYYCTRWLSTKEADGERADRAIAR